GVAGAPGGICAWYCPSRLLREEAAIEAAGYADPDFGLTELDRIGAPVFSVTTASAAILGPGRPAASGTWLFPRIRAKGNEAYDVLELRRGDMLLADAARERVFAPLYRWLMKLGRA